MKRKHKSEEERGAVKLGSKPKMETKRSEVEEGSWSHCVLCGGKAKLTANSHHNHIHNAGFGDEEGWLGPLIAPITDSNAIPRLWVHYQCILWSPEVYLDETGRLQNVKAALDRGKSLQCSHCKRRGATLGCRIPECQKTYHLACARSNACKFDHKEFLMACTDHLHIFQHPLGDSNSDNIKLRATKEKLERLNGAHHKDTQTDDGGGNEEFSKQNDRKSNQELPKIAPTYIGGEGEKEESHMAAGWESVAGLQHVIDCMKEVVVLPLLYPEFFEGLGIMPPRGVLLHGYPGTGKTHVVRALVGSCARGDKRIAYFSRKGADCLGKYVGDSEQLLKRLFQVAQDCQPSIIFFDEIDGLAPCRTMKQDQTHTSVVSTLLALLDGLKSRGSVVVIGATNRPDAIDPALRRPGRFDREIYFPLPSLEDRISILKLYTHQWPKTLESNGPLLQWIARKTLGFAGADLQALCTQTAIIALKRTFPLKQVLHASKYTKCGHPTHLPPVIVEERDWLEALSSCPPPCSRREATMAANDVVSSPLPSHLIPRLIRPLSILLVSLYLEKCICLPQTLSKSAAIIETVMLSALERKKMNINKWWSHVDDFIQEDDIASEIERKWQDCRTNILEDSCYANLDKSILEDNATSHANEKYTSFDLGNSPGFRIMIAGNPRSGQRHLASCILNCFVGHVEIKKVDMATASQGYNNLEQGISHTLANCLSRGPCLIFMPRIDLWALETHGDQTLEHGNTHPTDEQCIRASTAWTLFIYQVDSLSLSTPFIFLATSEVPFLLLPQEIRHFFQNDLTDCKRLIALKHKIPRFSIQIDETFNHDLVINQSAAKLSKDLVKLLVLLIHQKCHASGCNNQSCGYQEYKEISKFGDQILQNSTYSELCHATSKLKEGPSTNISKSHWTGWQFNPCVLHQTSSMDTIETEENYGVVKGLVSIGLMATRGVYTSLQQVCSDVRVVLSLFVEKINAKVNAGKDRLQYASILSQVASLEDTVYAWAYELQSSKQDSPNFSLSPTKIGPSSLPTSMCSITCCPYCLNILHVVIKKVIMHEFASKRFDWSAESLHDTVMSISVNLLTAVRKLFVAGMSNHSFDEKQREENYDKLLESYDLASCGRKISRNMIVMPLECSYHLPSRTLSSKVNASPLTEHKLNSKFIFSNNILVDLDPREEVTFHCKFESLCLSSLIQLIVIIKKPFN